MEAFVKLRISSLILLLSFSTMVFPAEQAQNPLVSIFVFSQKLASNLGISGTNPSFLVGIGSLATASVFFLPQWADNKQKQLDLSLNQALCSEDVSLSKIGSLITHGANVHKKFGGYPLLVWVIDAHKNNPQRAYDLVKLLLDNDAKANSKSKGGMTPLMYAASTGQLKILQLLLDAKASLDIQDKQSYTALMHSSLAVQRPCFDFLIRNGADTTLTNNAGHTVRSSIAHAVKNRDWKMLGFIGTINEFRQELLSILNEFLKDRNSSFIVVLFLMEDPKEPFKKEIRSEPDAEETELQANQLQAEERWKNI